LEPGVSGGDWGNLEDDDGVAAERGDGAMGLKGKSSLPLGISAGFAAACAGGSRAAVPRDGSGPDRRGFA
jgi:hypothetical protein